MSKGQSAIEYLMTYGWMLLVIAIVGGAIYAEVYDKEAFSKGSEVEKINTTEVSNFLEDRTGYTDCSVERRSYKDTVAEATCTRDIGEQDNMTFESGKKFTAELKNGSIMILTDYRY